VTDVASWSDYQTARKSQSGDGLGFVLNGDGIICIDLDHCFDGKPNEQAQALIDSLPDTYIEVSPSGTGLHIWGFGQISSGRRFERNGLSVEIYPSGRFITMTGMALSKAPLAKLDIQALASG
jgi:primase-polymerase (primpol)-like protein